MQGWWTAKKKFARPECGRGGACHSAYPERAPDHGRRSRRQAYPRGETDHARPRQRGCRSCCGGTGGRGAGSRFLPALSSLGCRAAPPSRCGAAWHRGPMVAQHTTSTGQFVAPDNWRAAPEEAPGGALTAVGVHALDHMIEFAGRVTDVRCVRAAFCRHRPTIRLRSCCDLRTERRGCCSARSQPPPLSASCSMARAGLAEISKPICGHFASLQDRRTPSGPIKAPPDEISEHANFDMLNAELTEFARCIRDRRRRYPAPIADVLHGMSVLDAVVDGLGRRHRESRVGQRHAKTQVWQFRPRGFSRRYRLQQFRPASLDAAQRVVDKAIDLGVTLFDTADRYGNSRLGRVPRAGARRKAQNIVLATKFGNPMDDAARCRAPRAATSRSRRRRA